MRKQETVTVPSWPGCRDAGKKFLITEWPAARAEKWGWRMLLLLKGSNERVPENVATLGMVGVAIVGLNVFLRAEIDPAALDPLMDQMLECVRMIRDPAHPDVATDIASDDDIMDVQTRLWLRSEVLRIHTGFSPAEALSKLITAIQLPPGDSSTT